MRKWKRIEAADGARFRSALDAHEAGLLRSLVSSMIGLLDERESSSPQDELEQLTGMKTGNSEPPDNATLQRLLPDFAKPNDDPEEDTDSLNSALRSLHEPAIIDTKRVAAQQLLDTLPDGGGKIELSEEAAHAWTASVNDLRLALGTMLEIKPDGPDRLPDDHPLAAHLDVYQWLTVLQEYLVLALMGSR
ncbi:DUF2017 domain-containing protein [Candidatus Mycobacterium wuenschmannii]|uniref:DUF2017 domain-containing protein n=1 Tax=Candidatus Mycobacterium wuenschmannii TaxID=3027808 RepID=A0ABY8W195_9MYCO|nr:DUF2017 domain-containing protein [Candidatus Mycobacterium wuenschmannii]WIM89658.1 DUF2017 domain-containing protein [Candidatus Mycobacterium wuenschmannii]